MRLSADSLLHTGSVEKLLIVLVWPSLSRTSGSALWRSASPRLTTDFMLLDFRTTPADELTLGSFAISTCTINKRNRSPEISV